MSSDGFTSRLTEGHLPVIAIWGVGLIGGALGMAWRRAGAAARIIGIGRSAAALDEAVKLGAIDSYTLDPSEGLGQADVVVLGAPVRAIIAQAAEFARFVRPGAVVTDVGSTKAAIVAAWERHLPPGAAFVGGHPMFGREVGGVANATADLPAGCRWVLTPDRRATAEAVQLVSRLAKAAGGSVRLMSPEEHDRTVAAASHLPQLAATALAATVLTLDSRESGCALDLAAGGFRDTTRLASSPADLWTDILATNPDAIRGALAEYRATLDRLDAAIATGDEAAIRQVFERAQAARRRLR